MSTSSGFPLLKLPLLALETCVNLMDPDTVIELALHSKVFKSRLSIVKWKIESVRWIMDYSEIGLYINSNFGSCCFDIRTQSEDDISLDLKGIQEEPLNLNGTAVSLAKRKEFNVTLWFLIPETLEGSNEDINFKSQIDTLENLTKFLMSFVKCSEFRLEYFLEGKLLSKDFFVWQYVKGSPVDLEVCNGPDSLLMTPDDLQFLLENLKFGYLDLDIRISDPNFKYQGPLEARELTISGDHSWIDLRNLNCPRVISYNASENAGQIEQILKSWIQGSSMENLEFLQLSKPRIFNSDEILKILKHENSRFCRADINQRIVDVSDDYMFRDIQRESDGRWGTVCIDHGLLYLIVWTPDMLKEYCQETKIKFGLE